MRVITALLLTLLSSSVHADEYPPCWEESTDGFIGCGTLEYLVDVPSIESPRSIQKSRWIIWRDDEETFVLLFAHKLPEVSKRATDCGFDAWAWMTPGDSPKFIPSCQSGRSFRPVGTIVFMYKRQWEAHLRGGVIKEYFFGVLNKITPEGRSRFSGNLVMTPEVVRPVYVVQK